MKAIFEEYGGIIIAVVVIVMLVAIVGVLLATNGPVKNQFENLINNMGNATMDTANNTINKIDSNTTY